MHRTILELAASFATVEGVEALVLAGSMSTGLADEGSDYDLYVYTREAVPLEFRAQLLKPLAARLELHNTFWEWSDEWVEPEGTVFDLMYRSCDAIEADVGARLGRGEASLGYSTCLCHSIFQATPVFDRRGWFHALQDRLKANPYPDRLVAGIIQKNLPVLGASSILTNSRSVRPSADGTKSASTTGPRLGSPATSTFYLPPTGYSIQARSGCWRSWKSCQTLPTQRLRTCGPFARGP